MAATVNALLAWFWYVKNEKNMQLRRTPQRVAQYHYTDTYLVSTRRREFVKTEYPSSLSTLSPLKQGTLTTRATKEEIQFKRWHWKSYIPTYCTSTKNPQPAFSLLLSTCPICNFPPLSSYLCNLVLSSLLVLSLSFPIFNIIISSLASSLYSFLPCSLPSLPVVEARVVGRGWHLRAVMCHSQANVSREINLIGTGFTANLEDPT